MKTSLFLIVATLIFGCAPSYPPVYRSTGNAYHASRATRTRFGKVYKWQSEDHWSTNIACIPTTDEINGVKTKYVLIATPRDDMGGTSPDRFNTEHGTSLRDTDAHELLSTLDAIINSPNDGTYYHFASETELEIARSATTEDGYGNSATTVSSTAQPTWATTFELTFHSGKGKLTLFDGQSHYEPFALDSAAVKQFRDVVHSAVSDLWGEG